MPQGRSKAVKRYLRKHVPESAFPLFRSDFLEQYKA